MKNLKEYDLSTFDFHKEIVKSKRKSSDDSNYKTRVKGYNSTIQTLYNNFDLSFSTNSLEKMSAHNFNAVEKATLLKLYSYKQKRFQKLKVKLTTDENNIQSSVCQNCTIGEVNSFDHYIPKDEFPEFVVNPKNLIPSCTKCNGYKSTIWRNNNVKVFLNLYLDLLPLEQYLFVDISYPQGDMALKFRVRNIHNIDSNLFDLIKTHYDKLYLCQRFEENSDVIVSELKVTITNNIKRLNIKTALEVINEDQKEYKAIYGNNYWKSLLKLALLNDKKFISNFQTNCC